LAAILVGKDKCAAPDRRYALVTQRATDEHAVRESEKVLGPRLEIIRVRNVEIPGRSLLKVSRGDPIEDPSFELERTKVSRPRQEKFNKSILEAEDQREPKKVGAADFTTGWNKENTTIVMIAIAKETSKLQPVAGQRWLNGSLKMVTNSRLLDRLSPAIEIESTILAAAHDVLYWTHITELGFERKRSVRWLVYPSEAE
jgi:hypothetical protein